MGVPTLDGIIKDAYFAKIKTCQKEVSKHSDPDNLLSIIVEVNIHEKHVEHGSRTHDENVLRIKYAWLLWKANKERIDVNQYDYQEIDLLVSKFYQMQDKEYAQADCKTVLSKQNGFVKNSVQTYEAACGGQERRPSFGSKSVGFVDMIVNTVKRRTRS